jgi:hypothetical protein
MGIPQHHLIRLPSTEFHQLLQAGAMPEMPGRPGVPQIMKAKLFYIHFLQSHLLWSVQAMSQFVAANGLVVCSITTIVKRPESGDSGFCTIRGQGVVSVNQQPMIDLYYNIGKQQSLGDN